MREVIIQERNNVVVEYHGRGTPDNSVVKFKKWAVLINVEGSEIATAYFSTKPIAECYANLCRNATHVFVSQGRILFNYK